VDYLSLGPIKYLYYVVLYITGTTQNNKDQK